MRSQFSSHAELMALASMALILVVIILGLISLYCIRRVLILYQSTYRSFLAIYNHEIEERINELADLDIMMQEFTSCNYYGDFMHSL